MLSSCTYATLHTLTRTCSYSGVATVVHVLFPLYFVIDDGGGDNDDEGAAAIVVIVVFGRSIEWSWIVIVYNSNCCWCLYFFPHLRGNKTATSVCIPSSFHFVLVCFVSRFACVCAWTLYHTLLARTQIQTHTYESLSLCARFMYERTLERARRKKRSGKSGKRKRGEKKKR